MAKTSLVIMAAGIGSRFGGGIKQLEPVGPNGEIIMDYSVHDALEAGFDRVVFIIRKSIEKDFRDMIYNRLSSICECEIVFQEIDKLPEGFSVPEGRVKPWGTTHAVLMAADVVDGPFAVINADDYYGRECFKIVHDYLVKHEGESNPERFCMAGFEAVNTLSENGGVSRGVCTIGEDGYLQKVTETHKIVRSGENCAAPDENGNLITFPGKTLVSMNMWGMTPAFFETAKRDFKEFLEGIEPGNIKAECYLPSTIDRMLRENLATVKVLHTPDKWYGVTFREDKPSVVEAFRRLYEQGVYNGKLF